MTGPETKSSLASPEQKVDLGVTYREMLGSGVELLVAPRHFVRWEQFVRASSRFSIALDGYVPGAPRFDAHGPRLNLNHHEDVDRLGTRSTCGQILMNLKQGLMETFSEGGVPKLHIHVNDSDQDVCTSVWLLRNHERVAGARSEPAINRLVYAEDMLDATAGAYPFDPRSQLIRELTWIFDPYNQSRMSGRLFTATGAEMAAVIAAVGDRINRYSLGHGEELPLDISYERLGGGSNWALIRETGSGARTGLYQSETFAFVAAAEAGSGRWKYSIGKMSPFVRFPVLELYDVLNKAEGIADGEPDRWGGGDIIGGSPRKAGSKLPPAELERVVNGFCRMAP